MTVAELEKALDGARAQRERLSRAISRLERLAGWSRERGLRSLARWLEGRADRLRARSREILERIGNLKRRLAALGHVPAWLPGEYAELWRRPWTVPIDGNADFKAKLWANGYASPNFTRREAGGTDRHPQGCAVPDTLRSNAQRHAFMLERVRHELGDPAMGPGSWYRCPAHNAAVGGASASQHMNAHATDWFAGERDRLGGERFDAAMERVFGGGGRGYQSYVGGAIRHVDNGPARTWVYA